MRWMWIDRILECTPGERIVAIKNVSLAEDYLHDHFPAERDLARAMAIEHDNAGTGSGTGAGTGPGSADRPHAKRLDPAVDPLPVMPAALLIEGMAQTAGILVGYTNAFKEKVVLAKVNRAIFHLEVLPGQTVRYEAKIENMDASGALASGTIEVIDHRRAAGTRIPIGEVELMFSHLDQNMAGTQFPDENFVFTENFAYVLREAGLL